MKIMQSRPDWSRIHQEDRFTPLSPFLSLASFVYGAAVQARLMAYRKGLFKTSSLPGLVISVGNLTAGGTGKTPATMALARWVSAQGYRATILSRGYGGKNRKDILPVSDGTGGPLVSVRLAGDEPWLLAQSLPDTPVVVAGKRRDGGLYAHERFGTRVFILDDGFQHLGLRRDVNLLLLDGEKPFGNGRLLPRGPLREPTGQAQRADVLILTRFGSSPSREQTLALLHRMFPHKPLCCADTRPLDLVFPVSGTREPLSGLEGTRVAAFAGIARPWELKRTLKGLGAEVVWFQSFPDHHPYHADEIHDILEMRKRLGCSLLVTTQKDWVRMACLGLDCEGLAYLSIEFVFGKGQEEVFGRIRNGLASLR